MCKGRNPQRHGDDTEKTCIASVHHGRSLSSVLAEVRSEAKIELINSTNTMMAEKNEELEKAKKAAKRVLKTEPDEVHPEQDEPENPEE